MFCNFFFTKYEQNVDMKNVHANHNALDLCVWIRIESTSCNFTSLKKAFK